MSSITQRTEFQKLMTVPFCEMVGKRYSMEVTTINGLPYVSMALYFLKENVWVRDYKKNYFMPAEVFMILFAKWPGVSAQICEKLNECMIYFFFIIQLPLYKILFSYIYILIP